MNERIEKLSQLAWTKTSETVPFYDSTGNISRDFNLKYQQEFAELIVRECIGCCEQVISDPVPESVDTWLNGGSQCVQEIKEHFGVEE